MTHKEIKPIRLSPPSRWDDLDTFGEEHPIDLIIRETVTPWPSESRIAGLQAILAEEVTDHGRLVLRELEEIKGDITREIKELAFNVGYAQGIAERVEPPPPEIKDEPISIRLRPPSRWDDLDDWEQQDHPIDVVVRETLLSCDDQHRIAEMQSALLEILNDEGQAILLGLEQLRNRLAHETKTLIFDLGFHDGVLMGRREKFADETDPYLTALSERLHRIINETPGPPRMLVIALMAVLTSVVMDLGPGEPSPPDDTNETDKPI